MWFVDCVQVVYSQDGVFVHTAVSIATQSANIIPGKVTIIEKVSLNFFKKNTQMDLWCRFSW